MGTMELIETAVGDLNVGDEFIDFTQGGDKYIVGWMDGGCQVEAYRVIDPEGEDVAYFDLEDSVQIERYKH